MNQETDSPRIAANKTTRLKAISLAVFIVAAIVIVRYTPVKDFLSAEALKAFFPFTPMNFGMGLTRVGFWESFFGTALGIIVGTFVFTFFIGTLKDVWTSGKWKVFLSIGLFVCSLFIPKIVKRIRQE